MCVFDKADMSLDLVYGVKFDSGLYILCHVAAVRVGFLWAIIGCWFAMKLKG